MFMISLVTWLATISNAAIVTREITFFKEEDPEAKAQLLKAVRSQFPSPNASFVKLFDEWGSESEKIEIAKRVTHILTSAMKAPTGYKLKDIIYAVKCVSPNQVHVLMRLELTSFCICKQEPCLPSCNSKDKDSGIVCIWEGTTESTLEPRSIGAICYKTSNFNLGNKTTTPNNICSKREYGTTHLLRLAIPVDHKPWRSPPLLYKPPIFGMHSNPSQCYGADSLIIGSLGPRNLADDSEYVERNMPRNPEGRSGITGQGLLRSIGKNEIYFPIIIRKRKRNVKEVLIYQTYGRDRLGPVPEFYEKSKEKDAYQSEPSMEDYLYELLKNGSYKDCSRKKFSEMFSSSHRLYHGYMPHPLTTDNAWVIGKILVIKGNEKCLNALDVYSPKNYLNLKWKYIDEANLKKIPDLKAMIIASPLPLLTAFILTVVHAFVPFPIFIFLPVIIFLLALQVGAFGAFFF